MNMWLARQGKLQQPHRRSIASRVVGLGCDDRVQRDGSMNDAQPVQFGHRAGDRKHDPAGLGQRPSAEFRKHLAQRSPSNRFADHQPAAVCLLKRPGLRHDRIANLRRELCRPHNRLPGCRIVAGVCFQDNDRNLSAGRLMTCREQPATVGRFSLLEQPIVAEKKRATAASQQLPSLPGGQQAAGAEPGGDRHRIGRAARKLAAGRGQILGRQQPACHEQPPEISRVNSFCHANLSRLPNVTSSRFFQRTIPVVATTPAPIRFLCGSSRQGASSTLDDTSGTFNAEHRSHHALL